MVQHCTTALAFYMFGLIAADSGFDRNVHKIKVGSRVMRYLANARYTVYARPLCTITRELKPGATSPVGRPRHVTFTATAHRHTPSQIKPIIRFAFALDIDGVLLQGPKVLDAAKRALHILEGNNPYRAKIPYILLTNGGGVSESDRCKKLTRQLEVTIKPSQYIQAHTILKSLVPKYADKPVLVLGGKLDAVRRVAQEYGYRKAYTTTDVLAWKPSVWPFHEVSPAELQVAKSVDFSQTRLSAVFVFHDPRNWALDAQVLCDILQSDGIIGGPYTPLERRVQEPVEIIFCNPDLLWRSDFPRPRLGQGAFREAFQGVYKALTGSTYPYIQYGKPSTATYDFAKTVLCDRHEEIYGAGRSLGNVYMIGDNPDSDIAGANAAGWQSILVHTGVFDPQRGPPLHMPTHLAKDVEAAVNWAIERELGRGEEFGVGI